MIRLKKLPSPAKKRELIIQALYQKEISGCSNTEVFKQFKQNHKSIDLQEFEDILKAIKRDNLKIDAEIINFSKLLARMLFQPWGIRGDLNLPIPKL